MVRKTSPDLPVAKCKRLVRPLLAKIHVLTDLYHKYPSKFEFEHFPKRRGERDEGRESYEEFSSRDLLPGLKTRKARGSPKPKEIEPPSVSETCRSSLTSVERLAQLKPLLSPELHRAYFEIFAICRNIFATLLQPESPQNRLSVLAATKLGKLVALGTKSTYYRLSQTLLFDADSIPPHLYKFHENLAEDIDQWLDMEPESVTRRFRRNIVAGYVVHVLVYALRPMLFLLVPVVAHWLHEQGAETLLKTLFTEYWTFLAQDPDVQQVAELMVSVDSDPTAALFWPLHKLCYWEKLACHLGVITVLSGYESLLLDCLTQPGRLDGVSDEYLFSLASRNRQHPHNTAVMMGLLAQTICRMKLTSSSATQTLDTLSTAYAETRRFVQAWLGLKGRAIFNSQARGNLQLFDSLAQLLHYISSQTAAVMKYLNLVVKSSSGRRLSDMLRRFEFLYYHADLMQVVVGLLRSYFLQSDAPTLAALNPGVVAEFFAELQEDSGEGLVIDFLGWLSDVGTQDLVLFAQKTFFLIYPDDEWYGEKVDRLHRILFE